MPRRSGIEAVEYPWGREYKVPIYVLTDEADQAEIDKVLAEACQGLLAKPLNIMLFFYRMIRLIAL